MWRNLPQLGRGTWLKMQCGAVVIPDAVGGGKTQGRFMRLSSCDFGGLHDDACRPLFVLGSPFLHDQRSGMALSDVRRKMLIIGRIPVDERRNLWYYKMEI